MSTARRTFVATGTVALLAAAGVTAAIAADPAPPPPPRIAFLANGIVPADALAAGPIAGQLGAPMYTTQPDALSSAAATGLDDYDPELVIVLGGPVAIHDGVIDQVEATTGLTESAVATPAGGIVRAAGGDRFDTAAAVADLLTDYNPAYLPINLQAIDADKLDGKDASDFALKSDLGAGSGDAETVAVSCPDGEVLTGISAAGEAECVVPAKGDTGPKGATGPQGPKGDSGEDATNLFAHVHKDGTLRSASGVTSATRTDDGTYRVIFDQDIDHCAWIATPGMRNRGVSTYHHTAQVGSMYADDRARVLTFDRNGDKSDYEFSLAVFC